jgi:hypothetical protein
MNKEQIASFKPPGMCWRANPGMSSVCLLEEDHKGRCGWDVVENECEYVDCPAFNCTGQARDKQDRWRNLCTKHVLPYTLQSAGRIPDEDLKEW